jgi:hypothetical protein
MLSLTWKRARTKWVRLDPPVKSRADGPRLCRPRPWQHSGNSRLLRLAFGPAALRFGTRRLSRSCNRTRTKWRRSCGCACCRQASVDWCFIGTRLCAPQRAVGATRTEQVSVFRRGIAAAHRAALRELHSLFLELQRGGVHAIAQAGGLRSLVEDVAQVAVAAGAEHFDAA